MKKKHYNLPHFQLSFSAPSETFSLGATGLPLNYNALLDVFSSNCKLLE